MSINQIFCEELKGILEDFNLFNTPIGDRILAVIEMIEQDDEKIDYDKKGDSK